MAKQVQSSHEANCAERLNEAEERHKSLDTRLHELARRAHLTPAEQVEVADIKKQKLKLKDEIQALRSSLS